MHTLFRVRAPFYALLFLLPAAGLVSVHRCVAQQTLGSILGTVTDPSQAIVQSVNVSLKNNGTDLARETVTDKNGAYSFHDLPIGSYSVVFTRDGFDTQSYPGIEVQGNRTVTLNAQLKTGQISTSVSVTGTPLLNATDTTNGYVLDNTEIQQTPLATGSFTQLAILAPGTNAQFINGTGTNEGLGNQAVWANGQRATDNTFTLNGVETSNLFNGNSSSQVASGRAVLNTGENFVSGGAIQTNTSVYDAIGNALPSPNPEAIQELKVNASMYDAQQGATSGAQISGTTLSGTNQYHGQTFWVHQTNYLNAAPFFYKQQSVANGGSIPLDQVNPQLHRNSLGATLGGPIFKDKLFGFLSYNAVRVTDQLNGKSSLYLPPGLTNDRTTPGLIAAVNSSLPSGATPFAGNFDPAAVALLQAKLSNGQYLIPSVASNAADLLAASQPDATLFGQPTFKADIAAGSLDFSASHSDQLSLKYFYQHDPASNPFTDSQVSGFQQQLDAGGQVGSIINSYTPSARFSWQQVAGFSREKAYSTNSQPLAPSALGINLFGYNTFPGITLRNTNSIFPNGLSVGPTGDFFKDGVFQNRLEFGSTAISLFGRHTLSYGGSYTYSQLNIVNRRQNTGRITFDSFQDLAEGNVDTRRSSFLQGAASRYYRVNNIGGFVQDKFQVRPNLSVTAGVRYDYDGPLVEKYGNLFSFDPSLYAYSFSSDTITNDGFIVAGNNKLYRTPGVSNSTLKNLQQGISPRLGFAWSPSQNGGRVVFRGGFGLYYNRGEYFTYLSPGAGSGISGPFGVTQEPPFVVPFPSPKGATLSNPFGTALPPPPTGNPAEFLNTLPNRNMLQGGAATYPFGAYDIHNKLPYTENWSFDMQWQPRTDVVFDLGYVGNRGRHGVVPIPFNQPQIATASNPVNGETASYGYQVNDTNFNPLSTEPYNTYDGGNTDLRVPFLGYSVNSVTYRAVGVSAYDALQVHAEQRLRHGLRFGASYTYAHALDEQSGLGLFYTGSNPLNLRSGYGSADFDVTHDVTFNYVYQFPDVIHNNGWLSKITNHWALQGITVFESGQPYSIYDYSGAIASLYYSTNDGITNPIVPLAPGYSPKQALTGASGAFQSGGSAVPALNANAFALPFVQPGSQGVPDCGVSTGGAPVCDVYETGFAGDGQRNIFRQAFQKRADISLVKVFPVTERFGLKYTFDVFNLTNTSSFDIPNDTVSTNSSFNTTPVYDPTLSNSANQQSLYSVNSNGTIPTGLGLGVVQQTIGSPRLIQMSLRLIY